MGNNFIYKFDLVSKGGLVKRYHTIPTIGNQNNAEHQWFTAIIVNHVYPQASKNLILAALTHDSCEALTGDIPSNAKREYRLLKVELDKIESYLKRQHSFNYNLTDDETNILKAADTLEMMLYCVRQEKLGNQELKKVKHICRDKLYGIKLPRIVRYKLDELWKYYS